MGKPKNVAIVGAGLAGLTCAKTLHQAGVAVTLIEAADGVGGRVRTDVVDGFRLDRGFQVFSTAYPEARRQLDYTALDLLAFDPGAAVRWRGQLHRLLDPRRRPASVLSTALSPVPSLGDKLRCATLPAKLRRLVDKESPTTDALHRLGFSEGFIERFWRPFLAGVYLERGLQTPADVFAFVTSMFASGDVTLPAAGMRAIPEQLASHLPAGAVRLETLAAKVDAHGVRLVSGEEVLADAVVVAADQRAACRLLGQPEPDGWRGVRTFDYAADRPPIGDKLLVLNGDGSRDQPAGPINSLVVPTNVAPSYGPEGQALVSVTVLHDTENEPLGDEPAVRQQLVDWFGEPAREWRLLRQHDIPRALPDQTSKPTNLDLPPGVHACGDWLGGASINGAMASGREAAERVLAAG